MLLDKADARARLTGLKLKAAGWMGSQVTREHYCHRDHPYTAGHIYLRGMPTRRGTPRRVDYLLRYTDASPIAVVEAKAEGEEAEADFEQAMLAGAFREEL